MRSVYGEPGESLGRLGTQSYCMGNSHSSVGPHNAYGHSNYASFVDNSGYRFGMHGSSIVNAPPQISEPEEPSAVMGIEETWVYKQAIEAKKSARARDDHTRKVVRALKKQQAAYQDWKATHDERERLYAMDYELQMEMGDGHPREPMHTSTVALDDSQRDAVSRAEKAMSLMTRRPPPPMASTVSRRNQGPMNQGPVGYSSEFSSPYG